MIQRVHRYIPLVLIALVVTPFPAVALNLESFKHTGAWVMPLVTCSMPEGNVDYIVIARETWGRDAGLFDAFGGKRDGTETAQETAAREFAEEAITHETLGMDEAAVLNYIDLKAGNTEAVLACDDQNCGAKNVLYITRFSEAQMSYLKTSFAGAHRRATHSHYKEKDALAFARFDALKEALRTSTSSHGIEVAAEVTDLGGTTSTQSIEMRPVLVKILRGYLEGAAAAGSQSKVHFSTIAGARTGKDSKRKNDQHLRVSAGKALLGLIGLVGAYVLYETYYKSHDERVTREPETATE